MYIQTIGPGPNSNAATKRSVITSSRVFKPCIVKMPYRIMNNVHAKVAVNIKVLLPKRSRSPVDIKTAPKFTAYMSADA
jgi:hypothetical protein